MAGYDVIVVGARCAGSPTAMLLARRGYRVVVVDRARFPSDTLSTHLIHPPGVAALDRWGLLDRVVATGCPPIDRYTFDFGPFAISGSPGTSDHPVAYAPRRTVLDALLVDAAREAGADVLEGFSVDGLTREGGRVTGIRGRDANGTEVVETAPLVVGADGRNSVVARDVEAEVYNEKPPLLYAYYSYWEDVPWDGDARTYARPDRGMAAWPTNDGLLLVIAGWPAAEFAANKHDVEGNFLATLDLAPELSKRVRAGRRVERFVGTSVPNFFREPFGPGWALVGDAGYCKDFITAQGMVDAFLDAELCSRAVDEAFSGRRSFDDAMEEYQTTRDERALPMYAFTTDVATLQPPAPEVQQLLSAVAGSPEAMDDFVRMNAGVLSPAQFFSDENVQRILAAAG